MSNEITGLQREVATLTTEVKHLARTHERMATALDKLAAIEAQNVARDAKIQRLEDESKEHGAAIQEFRADKWKLAGAVALVSALAPFAPKLLGSVIGG